MKVLLVEDSQTVSQRLRDLLGEIESVQVLEAEGHAERAIHKYEQAKPDAVILDLSLQAGSGFDVLRHVKADPQPPVVIILTNYPFEQYRAKGEKLGADYFFDKSTEFEEAVTVVRDAVDVG